MLVGSGRSGADDSARWNAKLARGGLTRCTKVLSHVWREARQGAGQYLSVSASVADGRPVDSCCAVRGAAISVHASFHGEGDGAHAPVFFSPLRWMETAV